jgi:antirestriction protein ArdC
VTKVLKNDKRAIFTAAAHWAALRVGWLHLPWAGRRATGAAAKAAVRRV